MGLPLVGVKVGGYKTLKLFPDFKHCFQEERKVRIMTVLVSPVTRRIWGSM